MQLCELYTQLYRTYTFIHCLTSFIESRPLVTPEKRSFHPYEDTTTSQEGRDTLLDALVKVNRNSVAAKMWQAEHEVDNQPKANALCIDPPSMALEDFIISKTHSMKGSTQDTSYIYQE